MPKIFPQKKQLSSLILLAVFLAVIIAFFPALDLFRGFIAATVTLPAKMIYSARLQFRTVRSLEDENALIRQKITEILIEKERYRGLERENQRLRALLDFKNDIGYDTVSARVIARDPNNWLGSFTIDKGKKHGITGGAAVCSARGLVGRIAETGKVSSSVILVAHPGFRAGAMLEKSRLHGVLEGDGKGMARMLYLPIDAEIDSGERVITSGYSREFPKGILIGHVASVRRDKTGLFKIADIEPSASAFDQESVLCLK